MHIDKLNAVAIRLWRTWRPSFVAPNGRRFYGRFIRMSTSSTGLVTAIFQHPLEPVEIVYGVRASPSGVLPVPLKRIGRSPAGRPAFRNF